MAHSNKHTVVIIGGGAAGIATAASMLKRRAGLDIAIVEPSDIDDYADAGEPTLGAFVDDVQAISSC